MKVTGIIAEYNPFHRGHKYQIDYCKKELHSDYVVVVMSGDYVQRGTPALLPKHVRAEMALRCGADLVLGNAGISEHRQCGSFCYGCCLYAGWTTCDRLPLFRQ